MPAFPQDLTEHEEALIDAVSRGEDWSGSDNPPTPEQLVDPAFVATMPEIRAAVIRALCLGARKDGAETDPYGIRIGGARITGTLDLSFATVSIQLQLRHCHITECPDLTQLHLPCLDLSASHLAAGLFADGIKIDGALICDKGFRTKGVVRLVEAEIGSNAQFCGAKLINSGKDALCADGIKIHGSLICKNDFCAEGEVRLLGADIRGNALFSSAHLNSPGRRALSADRAKFGGGLCCNAGFQADGEIRLLNAEIYSALSFSNAQLRNAELYTINADGITIHGSLFCNYIFSKGEIRIVGTSINGSIELDSARLSNQSKIALNVEDSRIEGSLFCRDGFSIIGHANFTSAVIEKSFGWRPSLWTGTLVLAHATAGQLRDCWLENRWTSGGEPKIDIETFSYVSLGTDNVDKNSPASRIAWIRQSLGHDFAPGPYETLAKALRAGGDDVGANQVGYAKAVHRAEHRRKRLKEKISPPVRWLWRVTDRLFGATVGYGYKPWKGLVWLVGFLAFGWLVFTANGPLPPNGAGFGIIKPAEPVIFGNVLKRKQRPSRTGPPQPLAADATPTSHYIDYTLPPEYTPFSPFWYSLDTLIPLVDLGQQGAWSPSPIDASFWKDPGGWIVLIYLYVHILAGWVLSTLTVVALTGVIKKD